jgi:Flp pilus assembly protein TadD
MRLSPRDANLGFWGMHLADALLRAGRTEEALAAAQTANRRDPNLYGGRVLSAIALTRLARHDEARAALAEARRILPTLELGAIEKFFGKRAADDLKPLWDVA